MRDMMDPLYYVQTELVSLAGNMGVAIEASNGSAPGDSIFNSNNGNSTNVLPTADPYGPSRYIEIYSRGLGSFNWNITSSVSWVTATPSSGSQSPDGKDTRVILSVDWTKAPTGPSLAVLSIQSSTDYGNYNAPSVNFPIINRAVPSGFSGYVESDKTIAIEAEHTSSNVSSPGTTWKILKNYGRTLSGVFITPVNTSLPAPPSSPKLSYSFYAFTSSNATNVTVYMSNAFNYNPSTPLKYAIAIDDEQPQIIQPIPSLPVGTLAPAWNTQTPNAVAQNTTTHSVSTGEHTLNLWLLEPGLVFQRIVVNFGGVRASYLGPPESMRVG